MAKKNANGNSLFKNNNMIWAVIGLLLIFVFAGSLTFLKSFYQTETYYVLSDEISDTYPARTLVDPQMLVPLVISEGSAPPNVITLDEINSSDIYTKYPLSAGDVLTYSNAGVTDDIASGVPEDWVITNFSVDADNAVGGRIHAGSYFDILVTSEEGSFYPFVNILALDTTVDLSGASSAAAADTAEAYEGQTSQYVVAMSPKNAGLLHDVVVKYNDGLKLVISPRQNDYNKPKLSEYSSNFSFSKSSGPIWPGTSPDGEITDSGFVGVERNAAGEPTQKSSSKTGGNARGEQLKIDVKDQDHPDEETSDDENADESVQEDGQ